MCAAVEACLLSRHASFVRQVVRVQAVAPGITVTLFALNIFWFSKICGGVKTAVKTRRTKDNHSNNNHKME